MVETDEQLLLAQTCIHNLRRILLDARKVHSQRDYTRMGEPILLEIQKREHGILEYLTKDLQRPITDRGTSAPPLISAAP